MGQIVRLLNFDSDFDSDLDPNFNSDPDYDNQQERPMRKPLKVVFGIGAMAAALVLGPTLAANINLGSASLEFGQGAVQATACDSFVVVTPTSAFVNAAGAGAYNLNQITLSDIANTCGGKSFEITLYGDTSATPLNTSAITVSFASATDAFTVSGASLVSATLDTTTVGTAGGTGKSSVTIGNIYSSGTTLIATSALYKVAVENLATVVVVYAIGATGPGGGKIFITPDSPGNPTGLYFEVAPTGWGVGAATGGVGTPGSSSVDPKLVWSSTQSAVVPAPGAQGTLIGTGVTNTAAILGQDSTRGYAVTESDFYSNNGKSDWFLPSKDELVQLCKYATGQNTAITSSAPTTACTGSATLLTGFEGAIYWSSSEYDQWDPLPIHFLNGRQSRVNKNQPHYVRPIRSFGS